MIYYKNPSVIIGINFVEIKSSADKTHITAVFIVIITHIKII